MNTGIGTELSWFEWTKQRGAKIQAIFSDIYQIFTDLLTVLTYFLMVLGYFQMAMQMGYLEKEQTKQKSSGLMELKAQKYSIEDKSRYPTYLQKIGTDLRRAEQKQFHNVRENHSYYFFTPGS